MLLLMGYRSVNTSRPRSLITLTSLLVNKFVVYLIIIPRARVGYEIIVSFSIDDGNCNDKATN